MKVYRPVSARETADGKSDHATGIDKIAGEPSHAAV